VTFVFSKQSLSNLVGVHPKLAIVVHKALEFGIVDFKVTCGVRTQAEQDALYAKGRTTPGEIVTKTRNSNHIIKSTGFGHAVDLDPTPVNFKDIGQYKFLATVMFRSAMENDIKILWGGHWKNPWDWGHYEIV